MGTSYVIKHIIPHFMKTQRKFSITGSITGTSKEKISQEFGLKSLEKRRWYQKLLLFCKIFTKQSPIYLLNIIPVSSRSSFTRYVENVPFFKVILLL